MQRQNVPYFSVGLTGGIGCGKSTVADLFAAHGASIVDTDQIAHSLTAPNGAAMPALVAEFGPDYADARGALDRTRMRNLVFSDAAAKAKLEAILHPRIRQATLAAAAAPVPSANDVRRNYAQSWSKARTKDTFGTVNAEYDHGRS